MTLFTQTGLGVALKCSQSISLGVLSSPCSQPLAWRGVVPVSSGLLGYWRKKSCCSNTARLEYSAGRMQFYMGVASRLISKHGQALSAVCYITFMLAKWLAIHPQLRLSTAYCAVLAQGDSETNHLVGHSSFCCQDVSVLTLKLQLSTVSCVLSVQGVLPQELVIMKQTTSLPQLPSLPGCKKHPHI